MINMIKSFKDFDNEINGQNGNKANDYIYDDEDIVVDDSIIPDLISDDRILLKICNILLKRLNDPKNGLDKFTVKPTVIQLNNTPSAYFYNRDKSINIVACRKSTTKYVYLFKEFNIGSTNVADLVLSTNTTGFKEIIDRLIDRILNINTKNTVNEARTSSSKWQEQYATYPAYSDNDVSMFSKLSKDSRSSIFALIKERMFGMGQKLNAVASAVDNKIIDELEKIYNSFSSVKFPGSIIRRKLVSAFYNAYTGKTEHEDEMRFLFTGTEYGPKTSASSTSSEDITEEKDVSTTSTETLFFDEEKYKDGVEEYNRKMKDIFETACALCNYVKNSGERSPRDRRLTQGKRCLIITGRPGTGKSVSIWNALTKKEMRKNKDYYVFSSGNTAAESLYKAFYNFNGKLLIFDDTADLFNTPYKGTLWQNALNHPVHNAIIASPKKTTDEEGDPKKKLKTYSTTDLTRQQRYFLEVGNKSNAIKEEYLKKEREKITVKYKEEKLIDPIEGKLTEADKREIERRVEKSWNEYSLKIKPAMPDSFNYNGVVVIITNRKRSALRSDPKMGEIWKSIEERAKNFEIDPESEVIWIAIKKKILQQTEDFNSGKIKSQEVCMIPPGIANKFIEFVEGIFLTERDYQYMSFRLVAENAHELFADGYEDEEAGENWWHNDIKELMKNKD